MSVDTYIDRALDRVESEQQLVTEEIAGLNQFETGVAALEPISPAESGRAMQSTNTGATPAATTVQRTAPRTGRAGKVRNLFAETIGPHSAEDSSEPLQHTIEEELGPEIAAILSPSTPSGFTPEVQKAIRSTVAQRRAERRAMEHALRAEKESLTAALSETEAITDWLIERDETPLLELGFDALQKRHETLRSHRSRCEQVSRTRQEVLHRTTGHKLSAGISHLSLVGHLYDDLEVRFPVLSTVSRLEGVCRESQRTVRDHLTRRV